MYGILVLLSQIWYMVSSELLTIPSLFINQTDNLIVTQKHGQHVNLPCIIYRTKDSSLSTQHANQAYVIWSKLSNNNKHTTRPKILTIGLQQITQDMRFRIKVIELGKSENNEIIENWQLEIRKLAYDDESIYQCQLPLIQPQNKHVLLKVKHDLTLTIDREGIIQEGESIRLKCGVTLDKRKNSLNNTDNQIKWFKNNHRIHSHIYTTLSHAYYLSSELTISHSRLLHDGNYSCEFDGTRESIDIKVSNKKDASVEYFIFNNSSSMRIHAINFLVSILFIVVYFLI